jgi:hypothetical protein
VSLEDTAVISLGTLAPGDAATLLARLAARPGIRLCGHAPWPPVRPDQRIGETDAAVFAAIARFCALVGWEYQRVAEPDPVRAANLRWLAGYRHPCYAPTGAGGAVAGGVRWADAAAGRGGCRG